MPWQRRTCRGRRRPDRPCRPRGTRAPGGNTPAAGPEYWVMFEGRRRTRSSFGADNPKWWSVCWKRPQREAQPTRVNGTQAIPGRRWNYRRGARPFQLCRKDPCGIRLNSNRTGCRHSRPHPLPHGNWNNRFLINVRARSPRPLPPPPNAVTRHDVRNATPHLRRPRYLVSNKFFLLDANLGPTVVGDRPEQPNPFRGPGSSC